MLLDDFLTAAVDATIRTIRFTPRLAPTTSGGIWLQALRRRRATASGALRDLSLAQGEAVVALTDLLDDFYQAGLDLAALSIQIAMPEVEASVLRQMDTTPAGIDSDLRELYQAMTAHVLDKVFGNA